MVIDPYVSLDSHFEAAFQANHARGPQSRSFDHAFGGCLTRKTYNMSFKGVPM